MKKIIACAAAALGLMSAAPAFADQIVTEEPVPFPAPRYYTGLQHFDRGHGLDPILKRYEQPGYYANELRLPAGAGEPAPEAAPTRVYSLGEASVPVHSARGYDVKGRASHDRRSNRSRAAWSR